MGETREELQERIRKQTPQGGKPTGTAGVPSGETADPEQFQGSVLAKVKKPAPDTAGGGEGPPKQNPGESLASFAARTRQWREKSTQRKAMDNVAKNPPK